VYDQVLVTEAGSEQQERLKEMMSTMLIPARKSVREKELILEAEEDLKKLFPLFRGSTESCFLISFPENPVHFVDKMTNWKRRRSCRSDGTLFSLFGKYKLEAAASSKGMNDWHETEIFLVTDTILSGESQSETGLQCSHCITA
jgi:hypothetical protein